MNPRIVDGWMVIDTNVRDHALVEIALFNGSSKAFVPAFRDYQNGKRVAKIRMPEVRGRTVVYVRVDGVESMAGNLII